MSPRLVPVLLAIVWPLQAAILFAARSNALTITPDHPYYDQGDYSNNDYHNVNIITDYVIGDTITLYVDGPALLTFCPYPPPNTPFVITDAAVVDWGYHGYGYARVSATETVTPIHFSTTNLTGPWQLLYYDTTNPAPSGSALGGATGRFVINIWAEPQPWMGDNSLTESRYETVYGPATYGPATFHAGSPYAPVPEPGTAALVGMGLLALCVARITGRNSH